MTQKEPARYFGPLEPRPTATRARYALLGVEPGRVLLVDLLDLDGRGPGFSVTNAAEGVVAEAAAFWPGRRIFYRDTSGDWSELTHRRAGQ